MRNIRFRETINYLIESDQFHLEQETSEHIFLEALAFHWVRIDETQYWRI